MSEELEELRSRLTALTLQFKNLEVEEGESLEAALNDVLQGDFDPFQVYPNYIRALRRLEIK